MLALGTLRAPFLLVVLAVAAAACASSAPAATPPISPGTAASPREVNIIAREYRFDPRRFTISFHASNAPNAHGLSFDYWGNHYATDGTTGRAYQVVTFTAVRDGL